MCLFPSTPMLRRMAWAVPWWARQVWHSPWVVRGRPQSGHCGRCAGAGFASRPIERDRAPQTRPQVRTWGACGVNRWPHTTHRRGAAAGRCGSRMP